MLISNADRNLLKAHDVKIDVNAGDHCGLITIQGQQYKVTLLTLAKGDEPTWETKKLDKTHMKNTAKKIAVILLKKELLQATVQSEFSIHNKGITTYTQDNEITVKHYNKDRNKNTRPDYDALMQYLSPCVCDTLDDTTQESVSVNSGLDDGSDVEDYLNRENIDDEVEQKNPNLPIPKTLHIQRVTSSAAHSQPSSPRKPVEIKNRLMQRKPLFTTQKRVTRKKNSEMKQQQLAPLKKITPTDMLRFYRLYQNYLLRLNKAYTSTQNDSILSSPVSNSNSNDRALIPMSSIPRSPKMINPTLTMNLFNKMYGHCIHPFPFKRNQFGQVSTPFLPNARKPRKAAIPENPQQQKKLALSTAIKRKKKSETLTGMRPAFMATLMGWENREENELANKIMRQIQQAKRPPLPKIEGKPYTPPKMYPTVPQPKHSKSSSHHVGQTPQNLCAPGLKLVLTAVNLARK